MLLSGGIYHLLNRGVDSRVVFQSKRDYERFLLTILECNSSDVVAGNRCRRNLFSISDSEDKKDQKGYPLVEILAFCLMPNHFHLVVKQLVDGGISKFMQRLGNSYTKYFNIKNERKGSLFMSRYKSVYVDSDSQFQHLITYVHANPLDLVMPEWRRGELKNFNKAKHFLESYKWSSYSYFSGCKTIATVSQIINRETVDSFYFKPEDHFSAICDWSGRYLEDFQGFE